MATEKRPCRATWVIFLFAAGALVFHLIGFVTPGWIILNRQVYENERIFESQGHLIDNGGVVAPQEDGQGTNDIVPKDEVMNRKKRQTSGETDGSTSMSDMEDGFPEHRPPHHGPHHGPHHRPHHGPHHGPGESEPTEEMPPEDDGMMRETTEMEEWMTTVTTDTKLFSLKASYGLWFSEICVKDMTDKLVEGEATTNDGKRDGHDKKPANCKKFSTQCALLFANMFEDPVDISPDAPPRKVLSHRNFGYANLSEHRAENCIALAFLVLGLVSAIGGFRKVNGCRYAGFACVIFMLIAAFIAVVPVARLGFYNANRNTQKHKDCSDVPYSVVLTGIGALCALVTSVIAGSFLMKLRKSNGGFQQFTNECEKKPGLVFYPDPLSMKVGLYDSVDFSCVEPADEVKKPLPPDADEGADPVA